MPTEPHRYWNAELSAGILQTVWGCCRSYRHIISISNQASVCPVFLILCILRDISSHIIYKQEVFRFQWILTGNTVHSPLEPH